MHDHAIHQLIRMTCTVHHADRATADVYGDEPLEAVTDTTERCHITQASRVEEDEVEAERWHLYFLPSTVIDANDTVDVDGMVLQLWGNPWYVTDPVTGWYTHIEASAVRRR